MKGVVNLHESEAYAASHKGRVVHDIPVAGPCNEATNKPGPKSMNEATNF